MNELTFSGDIVVYIVGLAATWGGVMWRIRALEKKMDKHNCLIERMAVAETDIKSNIKRLDILEEAIPRHIG